MDINLCVHIISSRTKCLKLSLESCYKHFNKKYNFPVYIYYFDDIYDTEYQNTIRKEINENIKFKEIEYGIPKGLAYNDICFVRENNQSRIGYHHMCHFNSNYYNYPNTEYKNYDLAFNFDDDSSWFEDLNISIIEEFNISDSVILTFNCYKYPVNHRSRKYRTGLCNLVKEYCKKYSVIPKHKWIQELLTIKNNRRAEDFFQVNIQCYDTNITKLKIFETEEHKNFMKEINDSRGIYKYRWGDNEVLSLFHDIHFEQPVFKISKTKEGCGGVQKYLNPGGLRHITDIAPSVKYPKRYVN